MKTIVRTGHKKNYTVLDNEFIRHRKLSLKAKGLLTYMLSQPDDWVFHADEFPARFRDPASQVMSGVNELIEAGYVKFVVIRHKGETVDSFLVVRESLKLDFPVSGDQCNFQTPERVVRSTKLNTPNTTIRFSSLRSLRSLRSKKLISGVAPTADATADAFSERWGRKLQVKLALRSKYTKAQPQTYAKQVRLLLHVDKTPKQLFITVMNWYIEHRKDQYVPKIRKVEHVREKFEQICEAMQRDTGSDGQPEATIIRTYDPKTGLITARFKD